MSKLKISTVDTRTARWQYLEWGFDKWSNENPNINVHFYYPSKNLLLTYFVLWNPLKCFIWEKCYNEHVMKRRRVTDRFALSIINTDISTIYVQYNFAHWHCARCALWSGCRFCHCHWYIRTDAGMNCVDYTTCYSTFVFTLQRIYF